MSLSEKPTHQGRARLSLPGRAALAATSVARPAPEPLGHDHNARLSPAYWGRMRDELAAILQAPPPPVFAPRVPLPLMVGIHADLLLAYPAATRTALGKWLGRWTATTQYRRAVALGGMRFDLDGNAVEEITAEASEGARQQLAAAVAYVRGAP